ncbi:hypothetical protein [Winogradskyella sp.]|uniref:hypothetical protein n=1 Tax=Winogradskyella sp. TaxID=1883156 RepID=UPI00260C230F|nr:hypothetical protein [Winogradskyella sp.]
MKNIFIKIIALFFLSILLTSNVLNLHVYLHEHEQHQCFADSDENHEDEENTPCELCLLVLNLNSLDYNNSLEFSYKSDIPLINNFRKDHLVYQKLNYDQLFSEHHRNKAPPHLI